MKIFVSCSSQDSVSDKYIDETKEIAKIIQKDNSLVFGASNHGLMGIVYREFLKNNRQIIGICYRIYEEFLKELKLDKVIMVDSLDESNKALIDNSDVLLFLPGAYGTFSELITSLELKRTHIHDKKIIIYNMDGFYDDFISEIHKSYLDGCALTDLDSLCDIVSSTEELKRVLK